MNENGTKRREWVKTAAIIFLSVLLVLTFFSNTIMNYSLPEVATQYVQSGTITAKIRGTGVVESGDPYNIMIKETRKVTSVAVREGDKVQQGDVLVYLEDSESDELKAAQDALETARDELEKAWEQYDLAFLKEEINTDIINQYNQNVSTAEYRQRLTVAQSEREAAKKTSDDLEERIRALNVQISRTDPEYDANTESEEKALAAAKTAKENADFALNDATNKLEALKRQLDYEISVSAGDAVIAGVTDQVNAATVAFNNAQTAAAAAQLNYDKANTALENKKASGSTSGTLNSLKKQLQMLTEEKAVADAALAQKQTKLDEVIADVNGVFQLGSTYDAVETAQRTLTKAQEEYDKLLENSVGSTVVAEIAGTVTKLNAAAGKEVSALEPVAVMQPEGKGYSMSFSVTNDQAKRLAVGDIAELVNSWRYDNVEVKLASIKPDTTDPGQKKLLTFDVSGDVTAGQSLNISVGQKSANYDMIVPNSAIREDNNGKFILIVETRQSPLGNRYIATRVDVEVLASDDTQSAITGGLYGYEFVITTSNKPVEAGKQVRLANNS